MLETLFQIVNTIALVGWILLIFAPRSKWTQKIVLSNALPLILATAYLLFVIVFWGTAKGNFNSLANLKSLFSSDAVMLTAWVHYLVFDMFVGGWEVRDSQEKGVSHWFVVPSLILTFIFGPIGFLLYYIVRRFAAKGVTR